jgi:LEA14-like dessication related protein
MYKMQELEFAGGGVNQVTTSGMDITVLACNPSPLPQSIDLMQAVLYSQSNAIGTFELTGKTVPPNSQTTLDGTITFQDFGSMKNFIGWMVNDQSPADFQATVLVKAKILDIIPYSYKKNYDFTSFEDILFGSKQWSCQKQGIVQPSDVRQQLTLAQARLDAAELLYSNNINSTNSTIKNP